MLKLIFFYLICKWPPLLHIVVAFVKFLNPSQLGPKVTCRNLVPPHPLFFVCLVFKSRLIIVDRPLSKLNDTEVGQLTSLHEKDFAVLTGQSIYYDSIKLLMSLLLQCFGQRYTKPQFMLSVDFNVFLIFIDIIKG